MKRGHSMAAAVVVAGMLVAMPTFRAQAELPVTASVSTDASPLASGLRSSTILGSIVRNEANETVGRIDDLIVAPNDGSPYAVVAVQGYLGLGSRYVVVPYESFRLKGNRLILPGATRRVLKSLPEFKYAS